MPNTEFVTAAREQSLIVIAAGDNVVRLLPPLIVTEADVTEAMNRLEATCTALEAGLKAIAQQGAAE